MSRSASGLMPMPHAERFSTAAMRAMTQKVIGYCSCTLSHSEPHAQCFVRCSDEESDPEGNACEQNVALKWMTEAGSSIYATPLITDLYSDGHKDIIVPTFVHQLEVSFFPPGPFLFVKDLNCLAYTCLYLPPLPFLFKTHGLGYASLIDPISLPSITETFKVAGTASSAFLVAPLLLTAG